MGRRTFLSLDSEAGTAITNVSQGVCGIYTAPSSVFSGLGDNLSLAQPSELPRGGEQSLLPRELQLRA